MFLFNFPIKLSVFITLSPLLSTLHAAPQLANAGNTAVLERKVEAPNALPLHEATIPTSLLNVGWWKQRHEQKLAAAKTAKCDILFIGDSITQSWEASGKGVWNEYYGNRNAFNIGFSGDLTQHVLWRLDNGEMDHFRPKVAVLMIGTNNTARQANWTAQKVADGVQAIIQRVHSKSPETQVLLLNVFPRGANKKDSLRKRNGEINDLISDFHDNKKIHYLDISSAFLDRRGNLSPLIMPDLLHPHAAGYKIWAKKMEPLLKKLLKQSKAPGADLNSAVVPVTKLENDFYDWHKRHQKIVELVKTKKPVDLIFVGDSITHMFGGKPTATIARAVPTWEKYYGKRNAINMGFGWDRTQNMLWRLQNGALDGITPKVAVVLAGTNNLSSSSNALTNTPEETAEGVKAICDTIHEKSPSTKILLLSILPRTGAELNLAVQKTNKLLSTLAKEKHITFENIWPKFADKDGQLKTVYAHDWVHPNEKGYQLWAEAMEPLLKKLLKKSEAPGANLNSAIVPVTKLENGFYDWHKRHQEIVELVKTKKPVDLIFVGDSITHMFGGEPTSTIARAVPTWEKYYASRNVINMGCGWDRTQNMLWRLQNGAIDGITPKVAVVLAGTNNLTGTSNARTNTPEEIAEGVKAICDTIHEKSPSTKILLLSILPRTGAELNLAVQKTNKLLSALAKEKHITFENIWPKFADKDGQLKTIYAHDAVHPNAKGYQLWAETIEPTLKKLLK